MWRFSGPQMNCLAVLLAIFGVLTSWCRHILFDFRALLSPFWRQCSSSRCSAEVIAQKLQQAHHLISIRSVERVISDFGLQKKLYACRPKCLPQQIETQRTRRKQRTEPCDPASLERQVRQLLADKISGNQVGIWLLAPEHLRLGTWDLLCA